MHPWGGFLPDPAVLDQFIMSREQSWLGLGLHHIHSSEGSVPLRERGNDDGEEGGDIGSL